MGISSMAEDFCRNMQADAVIMDCGVKRPTYPERFENVIGKVTPTAALEEILPLCDGYRWIVFFESSYNVLWHDAAKLLGANMLGFPMWECSPPWFKDCDLIVATSPMESEHYPDSIRLEWPIDTAPLAPGAFPTRPARRLLHNRGNGGIHDRNCTAAILAATRGLYKSEALLTVRALEMPKVMPSFEGSAVRFEPPTADRRGLYANADLLVHPYRFDGLSLPIREAAACGLPCIVPDFPTYRDWPASLRCPMKRVGRFLSPAGFEVPLHDADQTWLLEAFSNFGRGVAGVPEIPKACKPGDWASFAKQLAMMGVKSG